jgi:Domain of unknown function (DUF4465)/Secretion system C-terminal sorting domain
MNMIKIYINMIAIAGILLCLNSNAQTVSTFENINLTIDTFKNGSDWTGGFTSGNATFANHYDTSFGYISWDGFSISNKRDTVSQGFTNQYSAITGKGVNNSANYAVGYYNSYSPMRVKINGVGKGKQLSGFSITNSTYAYYSMKNGSAFNKKFGGSTGNDPDWFKLTIKGYKNGGKSADTTVEFYLVDLRFTDNSKDYYIKDWTWIDLKVMGNVDSIEFTMSSNDTAGGFGMNNPAYFCMDNFTTRDLNTGIDELAKTQSSFIVYPNPAKDFIVIESENVISEISIIDLTGKEMMKKNAMNGENISVSTLSKGIYFLQIKNESTIQIKKLIIE